MDVPNLSPDHPLPCCFFLPTTGAKGLDVLDLGKLSSRFVSVSCTNSKAGFEVGLKGVGWLKTVARLQDIFWVS